MQANTIIAIGQFGGKAAYKTILGDDPFGKFHYAWRVIYKTFKYYDCHFVQREENISELKKWGANRVETCFRSFD